MSSKARGLADLGNAFDDGALSNRNMIINGAMQVWQRGTSHSTSGYGSVDRWQQFNNTLISRSTDVPTNEGFQYSSKIDFAGSADSNFQQPIENGIGLTSGKSVTLSFWAKATGGITRFENVFFLNVTNFGIIASPAVSITNSWQRYTLTVTVPSYSASQYSDVLQIRFDLDPTESGSYYITGVQLEVGDTATPFEHRSYGDELARCQRYYYQVSNDEQGSAATRYGYGHAISTTIAKIIIPIYARLRTKPTISYSGTPNLSDATAPFAVTAIAIETVTSSSNTVCLSVNVASGLTQFRNYYLEGTNNTSVIKIDAEL